MRGNSRVFGLGVLAVALGLVACEDDPSPWDIADAAVDASVGNSASETSTGESTASSTGTSESPETSESSSVSPIEDASVTSIDPSTSGETTDPMSEPDSSVTDDTSETTVDTSETTGSSDPTGARSSASETAATSTVDNSDTTAVSDDTTSSDGTTSSAGSMDTSTDATSEQTETTAPIEAGTTSDDSSSTEVSSGDGGVPPIVADCSASCDSSCFPDCLAELFAGCAPVGACATDETGLSCWADGSTMTEQAGFVHNRTLFGANGDVCFTSDSALNFGTQSADYTWRNAAGSTVATAEWPLTQADMLVTCTESGVVYSFTPPNSSSGCLDIDAYGWTSNNCVPGTCTADAGSQTQP